MDHRLEDYSAPRESWQANLANYEEGERIHSVSLTSSRSNRRGNGKTRAGNARYIELQSSSRRTHHLTRQLQALGYTVTLTTAA